MPNLQTLSSHGFYNLLTTNDLGVSGNREKSASVCKSLHLLQTFADKPYTINCIYLIISRRSRYLLNRFNNLLSKVLVASSVSPCSELCAEPAGSLPRQEVCTPQNESINDASRAIGNRQTSTGDPEKFKSMKKRACATQTGGLYRNRNPRRWAESASAGILNRVLLQTSAADRNRAPEIRAISTETMGRGLES